MCTISRKNIVYYYRGDPMQMRTKSNMTKNALSEAVKALMEEHNLDKITIKMITDYCGFNRQTFYYHFTDIYDLVIWMFRRDLLPLIEHLEGELLWKEGLKKIFEYLEDNRKMCKIVLTTVDRESVSTFFISNVRNIVEHTVHQLLDSMELPSDNRELLTDFYIISIGSVLENWIIGQLDYSPDEIIAFLETVFEDHIRGVKCRYGIRDENVHVSHELGDTYT